MQEERFIINKGFIYKKPLELVINSNLISFENLLSKTRTVFKKEEIAAYRFGMKWIRLDLAFGREYFIYLKDKNNKTLKINFRTYFGRKVNFHDNQYHQILEAIWDCHFNDMVTGYLEKYDNREEFEIGDVHFSQQGIKVRTSKAFGFKEVAIAWKDIRTKAYYSNFSIFSSTDPININVGYSYEHEWNTAVLYSVFKDHSAT